MGEILKHSKSHSKKLAEIKGLGEDKIKAFRKKILRNIVNLIEEKGCLRSLDDFIEANVHDMVFSIIFLVLAALWCATKRKLRYFQEK